MKITFEQIFPLLLRYLAKGFMVFLGFGIIIMITDNLNITFYMDHIYPIIMSVSLEIRIIFLGIVGAIAHYTFWKS